MQARSSLFNLFPISGSPLWTACNVRFDALPWIWTYWIVIKLHILEFKLIWNEWSFCKVQYHYRRRWSSSNANAICGTTDLRYDCIWCWKNICDIEVNKHKSGLNFQNNLNRKWLSTHWLPSWWGIFPHEPYQATQYRQKTWLASTTRVVRCLERLLWKYKIVVRNDDSHQQWFCQQ